MKPNEKYGQLASDESIKKTVETLKTSGINVEVFDTTDEAKKKVLELIPEKSEVFTMTSVTLDTIGLSKEINESGKYDSVRKRLNVMNRETDKREMNRLGATPDWTVGSVHAVTEDGKVLVASNTGSQLAAYVYGASHVIWVVGIQKITPNLDEGLKRLYEYSLPLESERVKKAYGMERSNVSKILIVNKEVMPSRIHLIFVKQKLGF